MTQQSRKLLKKSIVKIKSLENLQTVKLLIKNEKLLIKKSYLRGYS